VRNPFARLAKRDTARPSLRERAASLKASASRVIRRKPVDAAAPVVAALPAADPILAAIAETRRLTQVRAVAAALPQSEGSIDPLPEQEALCDAFFAHVDGVLLKTVPTTAAGCVALARYAVEFLADEKWVLDEHDGNEHVRILDLIARSPMLGGEPKGRPFATDLSAMSAGDLFRSYNALKAATDVMGLTGWTVSPEGQGHRFLDAEADRLWFFQGDIADELTRRDLSDDRARVLIDRAVQCGDYDEAARFAAEADAKGL